MLGGGPGGGRRDSKEPEPDPRAGNLPRRLGRKQVARESQTFSRNSREVQLARTREKPTGTSEGQAKLRDLFPPSFLSQSLGRLAVPLLMLGRERGG